MYLLQYITPSVVNSLMSFATMDVNKASERLLKLAVPNHLMWLVCFYLIFHSLLNTLGELLQFADRCSSQGVTVTSAISSQLFGIIVWLQHLNI